MRSHNIVERHPTTNILDPALARAIIAINPRQIDLILQFLNIKPSVPSKQEQSLFSLSCNVALATVIHQHDARFVGGLRLNCSVVALDSGAVGLHPFLYIYINVEGIQI